MLSENASLPIHACQPHVDAGAVARRSPQSTEHPRQFVSRRQPAEEVDRLPRNRQFTPHPIHVRQGGRHHATVVEDQRQPLGGPFGPTPENAAVGVEHDPLDAPQPRRSRQSGHVLLVLGQRDVVALPAEPAVLHHRRMDLHGGLRFTRELQRRVADLPTPSVAGRLVVGLHRVLPVIGEAEAVVDLVPVLGHRRAPGAGPDQHHRLGRRHDALEADTVGQDPIAAHLSTLVGPARAEHGVNGRVAQDRDEQVRPGRCVGERRGLRQPFLPVVGTEAVRLADARALDVRVHPLEGELSP